MANDQLRLCGFCQTWHSSPCGEGCYWSLSDPTQDQLEGRIRKEEKTPDLMKIFDETINRLKAWMDSK